MQRLPGQGLPILFERPTYEWVARVNQKHKQLEELQLSSEQKQQLDRWTEIEFVYSTLQLEGLDIQRDQVTRIASGQPAPDDSPGVESARALFQSLGNVTSIAREKGKAAALSIELLFEINRTLRSQGAKEVDPVPVLTANARLILDNACQWFEADSLRELHPVEQASIAYLRLIEIRPFVEKNEQTSLLATSLLTLRSGLPPIIIAPDARPAHRAALNEGLRMNTKPMVELLAGSVERTLQEMILKVEK